MSLPWFRMYSSFMGDPVVQSLAFEDQRHYVIVLCLKCDGVLDRKVSNDVRERLVARALGLDKAAADEAKRRLIEVRLVNEKWQPSGWEKRQFKSDLSTERTRKHRKTKGSGNVPGTETKRSKTVSETDQIQRQNRTDPEEEDPPHTPPSGIDRARAAETTRTDDLSAPDWIDPSAWSDWRIHLAEKGRPLTPKTFAAQVKHLAALRDAGHEPADVINHSIAGGWFSLNPPDKPRATNGNGRGYETPHERIQRLNSGDATARHDAGAAGEGHGATVDQDGRRVRG